MIDLTVHHLRFDLQVVDAITLPGQKGSALRGALYAALRRHYCTGDSRGDPTHSALCPVCRLLATESAEAARGRDVPRPLTIEPPLQSRDDYEAGEIFGFGLSMVGSVSGLFPYLALAVPMMGREGVGRRLDRNGGARGRFALRRIEAVNPLSGERQTLLNEAQEVVGLPSLPVTWELAQRVAEGLPTDTLALRFLTPTRIVDAGRLVHRPLFRPLFQRLLERLISLCEHFGGGKPDVNARALVEAAEAMELVEDSTAAHVGSNAPHR